MSTMSIDCDRLKELADKAGPGPWTVEINDWDEVIVANESGHAMSWGEQVRFEMKGGNRNVEPHLIALAPDMARELLRLRDGIEAIRDYCAGVTTVRRSSGDPAMAVVARELGAVDRALADLLNGDTP